MARGQTVAEMVGVSYTLNWSEGTYVPKDGHPKCCFLPALLIVAEMQLPGSDL